MLSSRVPTLKFYSPLVQLVNHIHSSPSVLTTYHEISPKFGYEKFDPKRKQTIKEKVNMYREGVHDIKKGVKMWKDEFADKWSMDMELNIIPNQVDVVWKFDETTLNSWVLTSDSDHGEGSSTASLTTSTQGHGLFSGTLCTQVPRDGKIHRSGYCNIKSIPIRKSFERATYYEWPMRTHLVIRCRGDGRSYMLNLHTPGEFDLTWGDIYTYPLYTRGGPYWQVAKIPFSKFFFQSKGRVQDQQEPLPVDRVNSLGLSIVDQNNGPFQLELDYIGVVYDPSHIEEFAYEMYLFENEVRGIVHW